MAKFYKEDGSEVEAFTQEELVAKQNEAIEKYKKDNPGSTKDIEEAKTKIADLEKQLKEGGMSEGQKSRLKQEKEDAEKKLSDVTADFTKKLGDLEGKIFGGAKKRFIGAVAKDKETQDKISSKVESLMKTGEYSNDEDGIKKAVSDATTLIQGKAPQAGILDGITGGGDRGAGGAGADGNAVESAGAKAQRALLGISDADAAKYGPKKA